MSNELAITPTTPGPTMAPDESQRIEAALLESGAAAVGGTGALNELLDWSHEHLNESQKASFNAALNDPARHLDTLDQLRRMRSDVEAAAVSEGGGYTTQSELADAIADLNAGRLSEGEYAARVAKTSRRLVTGGE